MKKLRDKTIAQFIFLFSKSQTCPCTKTGPGETQLGCIKI